MRPKKTEEGGTKMYDRLNNECEASDCYQYFSKVETKSVPGGGIFQRKKST